MLLLRLATWLMVVAALGALVGLGVDGRELTGAPLWLKPLKFALSGALYTATIAWVTAELPSSRLLAAARGAIAGTLVFEIVLIFAQAARGTTSHFNVSTPLDGAIFAAMGTAIALLWLATVVVLVVHARTPAPDRAMALAVRLGLGISLAGALVGALMTSATATQRAAVAAGARLTVVGAHTVGAADGEGRLLPGLRWSASYGDLRVPHFVGLHAMQVLPLLLAAARRLAGPRRRVPTAFVWGVAALQAVAFAAVLTQALAGQPLIGSGG